MSMQRVEKSRKHVVERKRVNKLKEIEREFVAEALSVEVLLLYSNSAQPA